MNKPTYYLWRNNFSTQEEFEASKERLRKIGFRVVTFLEGHQDMAIHTAMKALVKNHWEGG